MIILDGIYNADEKRILEEWCGDDYCCLKLIEKQCYLLNMKGTISFEQCFGFIPSGEIEKKQKYILARPLKIIKYAQYYLLENAGEEDEWYVGEEIKDGNIEFYKCCESLDVALASI